jgi:iron only hydrogenase large subunit-like protein
MLNLSQVKSQNANLTQQFAGSQDCLVFGCVIECGHPGLVNADKDSSVSASLKRGLGNH